MFGTINGDLNRINYKLEDCLQNLLNTENRIIFKDQLLVYLWVIKYMGNYFESKIHLFQRIQKTIEDDDDILAYVVYGSFARGETYNDIDICLFLYPDKVEVADQKHLEYLTMFSDQFDIHIFSDLPLVIQSRVLNDGKILCNKDFDMLFDIYCDTIKEFNLFKPHLNTYLDL